MCTEQRPEYIYSQNNQDKMIDHKHRLYEEDNLREHSPTFSFYQTRGNHVDILTTMKNLK